MRLLEEFTIREKTLPLSSGSFRRACELVLEYLQSGNAVRDTFPISASWCRTYLPAWHLNVSSIASINKNTLLQAIPNALLDRDDMFDQGDVIEALVHFAAESRYYVDRHFLHEVIPSLTYWTFSTRAPRALGWNNVIGDQANYFFIISKGIYRIATTSSTANRAKVSFVRYTGIEAANAKLGGILQDAESISPKSSVLQLMYGGFKQDMFGGGEMHFFLYNNQKSIAIVQGMKAIVHKVTQREPEPHPGEGAALAEYRYEVHLKPDDREVTVTKDTFKYAPGEIDKFVIEFFSLIRGYNYEVSVLIDWYDIQTGKTMRLETPVKVVKIPLFYE